MKSSESGRGLLTKAGILVLGACLAIGLFAGLAYALSGPGSPVDPTSDWATVASSINSAIQNQYVSDGSDGESGFLITAQTLAPRTDPTGNGASTNPFVEGANMANEPVLVDVFNATTWIPGTSLRITDSWGNSAASDSAHALAVKNLVAAHRAAGLSTDIIVYCMSGNTESPVVMAYAAMAQAGYFGAPAPKVYGLKWGRDGWGSNGGTGTYTGTGNTATGAAANSSHTLATSSACTGTTPASELVRCAADNALKGLAAAPTFGPGGNTTLTPTDTTKQVIDLRTGPQSYYFGNSGAPWVTQDSLKSLFDPTNNYQNLSNLDSTKTLVFVNRTHHTAAMAAEGVRMLGYTSAWYRWGLPGWNASTPPGWPEKYSGTSAGYVYTSSAINTTAPTISGVAAGGITTTGANITWNTTLSSSAYPTTSMVSWSTTNGGPYTNVVRDTVLHGSHSLAIGGLSENQTIYYTVTSYDGYGAGTTSTQYQFNTASTPPVVTNVAPSGTIYSGSTTISANYSDTDSGINTSTAAASLDGTTLSGCTATATAISCPASGLAYGPHSISVSVKDNAGVSGSGTGSFNVGDNVAPAVSGVNGNNSTISASYSDVAPSSGINTGSVVVKVDSTTVSGCMATATAVTCPTPSGLAVGSHPTTVSVADNAGNTGSGSGTTTITQTDTTPPTVSNVQPSGTITTSSTTVSASYSDSGSGVNTASVVVKLDGTALSGCTVSSASVSCAVSGLANGTHTIGGSVADNAGNVASVSGSFTVNVQTDTTPPTVSNVQPSGTITTSNPTISADYSDTQSGINTASVQVYLDNFRLNTCTVTTTHVSCSTSSLATGTHHITGSVADNAGNVAQITGTFTTQPADTTPPTVTNVLPTGTITTNSPNISANYSDSQSGINTSSVIVNLDGSQLTTCTVTATKVTCTTSGLANGSHTISGSVADNAGNAAPISGSFTVNVQSGDTTPPTVSNVQPSGTIATSSTTISASYSDSGSGVNASSVVVKLDGTTLTTCTATSSSVSCPVTGLANGTHTIGGSVADNAGNVASISGSFTVSVPPTDTTPPTVSNVQPSGTITTSSTTLSADYSDSGSGVNSATVYVYLDGSNVTTCSASSTHVSCPVSGLANGSHTIGGSVSDNAGNTAPISGSFTVNSGPPVDTTPPTVSNVQPSGTITASPATISADYSDSGSGIDTASVYVYLDNTPLAGCSVSATNVSCPVNNLTDGDHTITGSVADNAGNVAQINGSFTLATGGTPPPPPVTPPNVPPLSYGLQDQMLFVANGRASNVAVVDVASMSIVDYVPVPRPPINANALAGQVGATLDKTIQGLGLSAPVHVPDMFYWEVHGVVPSADRGSIYAVGALSFTPADWTMYQVDTKTGQNTRQIPLAISPVGYCGLEYDRNDENSGVLYAESMETGPADLAALFGSPLQLRDPLAGLLNTLGLGGLLNTVEQVLPAGFGGISEENLASGTNTRFISTDYNADGSSSTCGIAWNASGDRAFASQMFEPLIDKINWSTKTVDGEILPYSPYRSVTQHQSTSAKSRGLLITATGIDGVSVFDMNTSTLVAQINMNSLVGHAVGVHGVEVAPGNDQVLYVTGDYTPSAGTYVLDIANINAPKLIGSVESGLDPSACGTYAIGDKQDYYRASGKCQKPNLSYAKTSTYWASYSDYANRDLSVNFNIMVSGSTAADNVTITGASATDGVTTLTPMPLSVGNVTNTRAATTTIRYHVPDGVVSFRTALSATAQSPCGDSYSYPGASGVGVPPAPPQA